MPTYTVEIRHTSPDANPEYTTAEFEAKDEPALREWIAALAPEMTWPPRERKFRPGWQSRGEAEFWGQPEGLEIVSILSVAEPDEE